MENIIHKLGKKDPINKKSVSFKDYVILLPNVPLVDSAPSFTYPMDLNDTYGDCVVAGFDHFRQTITGLLTGTQKNFTTTEIETFYKTQNPGFPQEDNGMNIQTFLEYLAKEKYILGFAKIDHRNEQEMKGAIYMGLAVLTGAQLQQAQETQFSEKKPWDTVIGSPYIGGHCTVSIGYKNSPDQETVVTWGAQQQVTKQWTNQIDEAWFVLLQEHIDHPTFRNHFNLAAFSQSVREITEGKIIIPVPVDVVPPLSKLDLWCKGGIQMEGADPVLNNPGNIRFVIGTWMVKLATGEKNGFCIFPDYQTGYNVLKEFFTNACTGKSTIYHPTDTLYQFYAKYAPSSDGNNPNHYAEFVAGIIGVPPTTEIKNLII